MSSHWFPIGHQQHAQIYSYNFFNIAVASDTRVCHWLSRSVCSKLCDWGSSDSVPVKKKRTRQCGDIQAATHLAGPGPRTTSIHHLTNGSSSKSTSYCTDGDHLLECDGRSCENCGASDDHCVRVHPFAIVRAGHVVSISILRSTYMRVLANILPCTGRCCKHSLPEPPAYTDPTSCSFRSWCNYVF